MSVFDTIAIAAESKAYKWHLYQIDNLMTYWESDAPCALFYHEEDAMAAYDHLLDKYKSLRFVLTNVKTGESYCA